MKHSLERVWDKCLKESRKKGELAGYAKGTKDGLVKGLALGRIEGIALGKKEDKAETILALLSELSDIPIWLKDKINSQNDPVLLIKLIKLAAGTKSLDHFISEMDKLID